MRALVILAGMAAAVAAAPTFAEPTPYAGQDGRAISSLSEADTRQLLDGDGWGLAKPAEFNGWPGPRHVLDLADDLDLSAEQVASIQAIFDAMNAEARALGATLIERERALDAAFETGEIDADRLAALIDAAEAARGDLREIHLAAHIATTPILTRHQKMTYAKLRGYGDASGGHGHSGHK